MDRGATSELAIILGLSRKQLEYLLSNASVLYRTRREPKTSGGYRIIQAPHSSLKRAQRRLLTWLYRVSRWHYAASAGYRGASILRHARPHVGRRCVLTMDIKAFFDSVNYGQVRAALERNGVRPDLAVAITKLTTRKRALPQGAPTSPLLGNLVLYGLDRRVSRLCERRDLRYTRYVDDLAISGDADLTDLIETIEYVVTRAGFRTAREKTTVRIHPEEQVITGLAVNDGLAIPHERRGQLRAIFQLAARGGTVLPGKPSKVDVRRFLAGHLRFVRLVDRPFHDELLRDYERFCTNL